MTIIKPFRGYRYNPKTAGGLSNLITPPYDVISGKQQASYYKTHPSNFIRLDLGKIFPKDNEKNNRYTRAAKFLYEWIDKGILTRDNPECIYIYSQEYNDNGGRKERLGFISLAKLEEDRTKGFLPHERTFRGPKLDRLRLMKETGANLSPIFSIIFDENKKIINILKDFAERNKPVFDVRFDGIGSNSYLGFPVVPWDITGDNIPELAIGSPGVSSGGRTKNGAIYIMNLAYVQNADLSITQEY